jgi:hypothetical protein
MTKHDLKAVVGSDAFVVNVTATKHAQANSHVETSASGWYVTAGRKHKLSGGFGLYQFFAYNTNTLDEEYDRLRMCIEECAEYMYVNVVAVITRKTGEDRVVLMDRDIPCEPPELVDGQTHLNLMSAEEMKRVLGDRAFFVEFSATKHAQEKGSVGTSGSGWFMTSTYKQHISDGVTMRQFFVDKTASFQDEYKRLQKFVDGHGDHMYVHVWAIIITRTTGAMSVTWGRDYVTLMDRNIPCDPPAEHALVEQYGTSVNNTYIWFPRLSKLPEALVSCDTLWKRDAEIVLVVDGKCQAMKMDVIIQSAWRDHKFLL